MAEVLHPTPAPEEPPAQRSGLMAGLRKFLGFGALGIGALVLFYLFYVFGLPDFQFWKAPGQIYVESPEVYTRERLVNDRYLQAAWLNRKLQDLDGATFGADIARSSLSISAGSETQEAAAAPVAKTATAASAGKPATAAGAGSTAAQQGGESAQPQRTDFPYDIDYDLRAAMRDKIRQDIIENMLDDRHDLTGNSLVALKFDTTVLKRSGARYNAKVTVKVTAEKMLPATENETSSVESKFINAYYLTPANLLEDETHSLHRSYIQYGRWLANLEYRLNVQLVRACQRKLDEAGIRMPVEGVSFSEGGVREMFRESLYKVLSVHSDFDFPETIQGFVPLPEPWSGVLVLQYKNAMAAEGLCSEVKLTVFPVDASIYTLESDDPAELDEVFSRIALPTSKFAPITRDDVRHRIYFTPRRITSSTALPLPGSVYGLSPEFYDLFDKKDARDIFSLTPAEPLCIPPIAAPTGNRDLEERAAMPVQLGRECKPDDFFPKKGNLTSIYFPAGYFSFLKRVEKSDSYLYSLIPNGSSTARILSKSASLRLNIQTPDPGGAAGLSGLLGHETQEQVFDTEPEIVTFGTGGGSDAIEFGWISAGKPAHARPEGFSQTALLSVPAWADEIVAEVTPSWIDESGEEAFSLPSKKYPIPVPPDYEIFDAFLADGEVYRRPNIDEQLFDRNVVLHTGRKGSVIIPGIRLWRSTVVTLGSQKADEIFVLPDMKGVIATFNIIESNYDEQSACKDVPVGSSAPQVAATEPVGPTLRRCSYKLPLRVWTSEGMDAIDDAVTIVDQPAVEIRQAESPPSTVQAEVATPK
ncbi:hypothetical protein [Sinorhizobium sp. BG8]|uniref:hypothetical protein n=1 Tax=Sinorhizobium sp. BG8 TaxID=2613773 RepID=UPI00193CEFB0|nr:hypothetical protein [Sinorhizobium sp. BG8]QRM55735.1 hypothetical protein F3Y30_15270 [Sinorhizobium sp. BG8]